MTGEEHTKIINQLRITTDEAEKQKLLLQLSQDYTDMINTNNENEQKIKELNTTCENYKDINNKLWLERTIVDKSQCTEGTEGTEGQEGSEGEPKKLEYEDLDFSED